jgi:hypothetical protein
VGYRRLVTPAGSGTKEESIPIHVADLARLTKSLQPLSPAAVIDGRQRPHDKRARGQDSAGNAAPRLNNPEVAPPTGFSDGFSSSFLFFEKQKRRK